jgi:hypothetical protein
MFAYLEDLTAIQAHSGWRTAASEGEAEALDYVASRLGEFKNLKDLGLDLERQDFRVFLGTELWETRLHLTVDGQEVEVPADGLRGPTEDIAQALHFDSDGVLNDRERNPIVVEGPAMLLRSRSVIAGLDPADVQGKVVFVDYAIVDKVLSFDGGEMGTSTLLSKDPAGIVLVTEFSNAPGESHGAFVADNSALTWEKQDSDPPVLYVRLEDLAPAGITDWEGLSQVQAARLTWDADVFSPADSGNLVAHIPGVDASKAMILGAHIDSPNSPGALDDGSGSVVLLEVARVLDEAQVQPPVDLYVAWFGSEEGGLYGSSHFVATHQELLDRTLAMLQIDCLAHPLDGIDAELNLIAGSYGRFGDSSLPWPDYLAEAAAQRALESVPVDSYEPWSDNAPFWGFNVPNADLHYGFSAGMEAVGGLHYAGHIHDPYETVELAREVGHVLEQMAHVALVAALEPGRENPKLRIARTPDRRALFVGSHTEPVQIAPTTFTDLGMALAWEGFDVDWIPYGQRVTPADLTDADMVIGLPVLDYPSPDGDPTLYDEAWSPEEIDALEKYVLEGGFLVLTNSYSRLHWGNMTLDPNEDWGDVNALATRFGVSYEEGETSSGMARPAADNALMEEVKTLALGSRNAVPFAMSDGQVLAETSKSAVAGLVDHGDSGGQVLVLADVSTLGSWFGAKPANLTFWQNLAAYARSR